MFTNRLSRQYVVIICSTTNSSFAFRGRNSFQRWSQSSWNCCGSSSCTTRWPEQNPHLSAFVADSFFPASLLGPELAFAFCWLALTFRGLDLGGCCFSAFISHPRFISGQNGILSM